MLIALTWGFEAISGKEDELHVRVLDYLLIVKKKKSIQKMKVDFYFKIKKNKFSFKATSL